MSGVAICPLQGRSEVLGVKGSQVQILSSRRSRRAPVIWSKGQVTGALFVLLSILRRSSIS
jgi:hypothetical protein